MNLILLTEGLVIFLFMFSAFTISFQEKEYRAALIFLAGTDCGRCVIVCPWSHPDNWLHRMVRFGIRNSAVFRRLAIRMDDLFYGRKPGSRKM
jgi:ferredoxin